MSWITVKMELKDNQAKTGRIHLSKFTLNTIREGQFLYKLIVQVTNTILIATVLSLSIFRSLSLRVFPLIYTISFFSSSPYTWTVDCSFCFLSHQHPFEVFSDSCKLKNTVQRSLPHKCGQRVRFRAFNVVIAAFFQIFLSFHPSCTFITYIPISGISQKVTLNDRIYIWSMLRLFEEILLLGPPPSTFLFATYSWDFKLNTLTIVYSSLDQPTSSTKAQGPIYNFGLLSLYIYIYIYKRLNI